MYSHTDDDDDELNFQIKRSNWYQRCSLCWKLAFSVF